MGLYPNAIRLQLPSWHKFNNAAVVYLLVVVLTLIVGAAFHILLRYGPTGPIHLIERASLFHVALSLLTMVSLFGAALIVLSPAPDFWKHPMLAGLVGLYQSALYGWLLYGTPFSFQAYSGDALFIASSIVKYMTFHTFVDFNYIELPAFYPPLYFYIVGKIASMLGIDPVAAPKFGVTLFLLLVPFALQLLWMRCVSAWVATSMLVILFQPEALLAFMKPYELISAVLFVPWWLHYIEGVSNNPSERRDMKFVITGGAIGGAIFMTYYYPFFLAVIALPLTFVLRRVFSLDNSLAEWRSRFTVLFVAALASSVYWLPYLVSMLMVGGGESLQNRWFSPPQANIPIPFGLSSLSGLLAAIGIGYLALWIPRGNPALAVAALILSGYIWFTVGLLGVFLDIGLLIRMVNVFVSVWLFCAGVLGLSVILQNQLSLRPISVSLVVLAIILIMANTYSRQLLGSEGLMQARELERLTALDQTPTWVLQTINNPSAHVLLSDLQDIAVIAPVHFFVTRNAHYSHPAGLHSQRVAFLEALAQTRDPRLLVAALSANRYSPIDYILLAEQNGNYSMSVTLDNFPQGTKGKQILFSNAPFQSAYFTILPSPYDNYHLIIPKAETIPLARADLVQPETLSYQQLLIAYQLYEQFGDHIATDHQRQLQIVRQLLIDRYAEADGLSDTDRQIVDRIVAK